MRREQCALAVVRRTHTQTGAITIPCAAASLARSVIIIIIIIKVFIVPYVDNS